MRDELFNGEHLIQMTEILGPLPQSLRSRWRRADEYCATERLSSGDEDDYASDEELTVSDSAVESSSESEVSNPGGPEAPLASVTHSVSLDESIKEIRRVDIDHDELVEVVRLVRKCLQYDPADRPSVSELLEEPWFYSADAMEN
ncbi:hypothetical protein MGN70_001803 [Eutypa lata]|nr:hypothetical protein MGN70_001803 [Eutypa lata]